MKPHKLGNPIYDTKELLLQFFPEAPFFFAGSTAAGTDIPSYLDAAQAYLAVRVVAIVVHRHVAFWTHGRHCSPKNPRCRVLEIT